MRAHSSATPAKAMILAVFFKFLATQDFAVYFQEGDGRKSGHGVADASLYGWALYGLFMGSFRSVFFQANKQTPVSSYLLEGSRYLRYVSGSITSQLTGKKVDPSTVRRCSQFQQQQQQQQQQLVVTNWWHNFSKKRKRRE